MAHSLDDMTITVRGVALFKCGECFCIGRGNTVSFILNDFDNRSLKNAVADIHPSNMPEGWASYGRGVYRCPAHKK